MTTITKQQAIDRLSQSVNTARPYDLVEIYNELFPNQPATEDEANRSPSTLIARISEHIDQGLEVEEILDLWNVTFPKSSGVWYDEDTDLVHYDEETEPVSSVD